VTANPSPESVVEELSAWLESMRRPTGYGGPVSHWWRDSLRYCGPGLDWRYEGVIDGYLTLWHRTGRTEWLDRAQRAGDDLREGQLDSGNFHSSAFERNPELGGTPHEATASTALLRLARSLDVAGRESAPYVAAAEANLDWHEDELWRPEDRTFSDSPGVRSFVPNKIASTAEAFLELALTTDRPDLVDSRVLPALDSVGRFQVHSGPLRGAIHQLATPTDDGIEGDGKFFPIYIARCVPPFLQADVYADDGRFQEMAFEAGRFLKRVAERDGSYPAVVYRGGQRNRYPKWIAGLGDVLRAFDALDRFGHTFETWRTEQVLFDGFDDCGAFRTANGFGRIHDVEVGPSFRDVLHVVGWNDKAFRWIARRVDDRPTPQPASTVGRTSVRCWFGRTLGTYVEDRREVSFAPDRGAKSAYRWDKVDDWARLTE